VDRVARWTGSAWEPLGSGVSGGVGGSGGVYALAASPDGSIYAGGSFTTAGGVSANNGARWTGASWEPLGAGVNGTVYALAGDRLGDLVLGGSFTAAGTVSSPNVTLYDVPAVVSSEGDTALNGGLALSVAPNPASSGGTIRVTLPEAGPARVTVYDVLGRKVAVLAEGEWAAGAHEVALDAGGLAPGVYVVRVTVGRSTVVARITVAL
jgi:hypothetical protein